jgi:hypothetical protein
MGVAIAKLLLAGGHRVEAAGLALPLRCTSDWVKNPEAPAVKREAEEDWGGR